MRTTLNELLDTLLNLIDEGVDGDTEVRINTQPNYPLQFELEGVGVLPGYDENDEHDGQKIPYSDEVNVIYLLTGNHPDNGNSSYGPSFGILQDEVQARI